MSRHSLPNRHASDNGRGRAPRRRVAIAGVLVVAVAAGAGIAGRSTGLFAGAHACADSPVHLHVVASPDIAPALQAMAKKALHDKVTSDGSCLDVQVSARENSEVAHTLATSSSVPDYQVWIPDSTLWTDRSKATGNGVPLTSLDSVATSPVTLAAAPATARALNWPHKNYTWSALASAVTDTDKMLLGSADPARSATGLLALSSIAQSSQKDSSGSGTRLAAMAKLLSPRITDSDSDVTDTLPQDSSGTEQGNPQRNNVVFLSEQAAFAHNAQIGAASRLDLVYPSDLAPALDYPYTLVDPTEQSTAEGRAATRFLTLLNDSSSHSTLEDHGFRVPDTEAPAGLAAMAGARAPQPYGIRNAQPPSSEAVQQTLGLWTVTVQSARLTVVVDASGSMAETVPGKNGRTRMDVTKTALMQALSQFTPEDEIGLWKFATHLDGTKDYRKLVDTARLGDPVAGGGTHRDQLSDAFSALEPEPGGGTGLYDTALAAYKAAKAGYVNGKLNTVVLLTDGSNDDPGSISPSALVGQLKSLADPERPVPVIALAIGPDADRDEVDRIAKTTGGGGYEVSDPADIQSVILKAMMAISENA